jgi:uncharacterized protein (TIGR03086 family)
MATVDQLELAMSNTARIVDGIGDDQWSLPTPCDDWDVRAVTNHAAWVIEMFGAAVQGDPPPSPRDTDVLGDDPARRFRSICEQALAAWRACDLDQVVVSIPIGDLPGAVAVGINTTDVFVHGWDLARATDQNPALDPAVCEVVLAITRELLPPERRTANFAPPIDIAASAPLDEQLVAWLGRKP